MKSKEKNIKREENIIRRMRFAKALVKRIQKRISSVIPKEQPEVPSVCREWNSTEELLYKNAG